MNLNPDVFLLSGFLTLLPISELRGGLPAALMGGIPLPLSLAYCIALNALVGPLVYLFLATLHKLLIKWSFYQNLFEKIIERARHKLEQKIQKYGYIGLTLFVGIPLPVTGAYTGALGAWILGLDFRKSVLAISLGLIVSATLVTLAYYAVTLLGVEFFNIFFKLRS